jgi:SAM-dependent methyltransferase
MNESQKIKNTSWYSFFVNITDSKKVLDIGCGALPVFKHATPFDRVHGDASDILKYINDKYDVVYSSHCLEHMQDPERALLDWYSLVKSGGYLVITIPHEVLYEQCFWPSIFNSDHKSSFRINGLINSDCYKNSISIEDAVNKLPGSEIITITVDDYGFDYRLIANNRFKKRFVYLELFIFNKLINNKKYAKFGKAILRGLNKIGIPFDQTLGSALAQITFILKKI